jgi:hypothetical protein
VNSFDRLREHFTVEHVSGTADLAVKFAAIVLGVGAVAVVFFGPKIQITTSRQTFIDTGVLRRDYRKTSEVVPPVVKGVAATYNRANTTDLLLRNNATGAKLSAKDVCRRHGELLRLVYPDTDCAAAAPVIGRNHYWERLLINRVAGEPDLTLAAQAALATTAVNRIYDSQYVKVYTVVRNTGHSRAINVNVRVPDGFSPATSSQSVSPFTLGPDDPPVERFYRTASGIRESEVSRSATGSKQGSPVTRFAVDWERDENSQANVVVWVGAAFAALWLAIVLNDSRLRAKAGRSDVKT